MDESLKSKDLYCYCCLCSNDENSIHSYDVPNGPLKTIFQMDLIYLCYICKRMAHHAHQFIQSVQSNQILLENFNSTLDATFQVIKSQIQPPIHLMCAPIDTIELTRDTNSTIEGSFAVVLGSNAMKIKLEMKEEDELEHLEGEFLDTDDFQESCLKEEDSFPLKALLKEELEAEDIDIKTLRKSLKRRKEKKSKKNGLLKTNLVFDETLKVVKIRISMKQCLEERAKKVQDKKYINMMYKCEDCVKGFNFKAGYEKHLERHKESMGNYRCDICKQHMDSEEKLLRHQKYHFVRYKCLECGLTRVSHVTIKDHITAIHLQSYQYRCPHCSKVFKRQVSLRKHILYVHRQNREMCVYCEKTYSGKDGLKNHMMMKHPTEVSAGEVSKKFVCQECGMRFKAPSQLKNHAIKHSQQRDYYCVECDKSFKSDAILKHHLKTAASHIIYTELPLACSHCDKRFAIRRDLDRHTNRVHLNIKPFKCDRCDKAYINGWSLTQHRRLAHEGYKRPLKFPCPMCDKVFDRNHILKGHIRTHTGERPYQCKKCPAQFSQASILGTHNKLIHLKLTRDGRPKAVAIK